MDQSVFTESNLAIYSSFFFPPLYFLSFDLHNNMNFVSLYGQVFLRVDTGVQPINCLLCLTSFEIPTINGDHFLLHIN